jgi:hypothetical protein
MQTYARYLRGCLPNGMHEVGRCPVKKMILFILTQLQGNVTFTHLIKNFQPFK